jgi:archaellum component FlaC
MAFSAKTKITGNKMQIHYALYDQSSSNDGNYWTWFDESLPRSALNKFYSDFAAKHLPEKPNDLMDTDLWGGAVTFDGYLVLYRCVNGGYDRIGRPQRGVIITAWLECAELKRADIVGADLSQIFDNDVFRFTQEHAREIPVPQPEKIKLLGSQLNSNRIRQNITSQVDDLLRKKVDDLLLTKEMRFVTGNVVSQALELLSATLSRSASGVRFIIADIEKTTTQERAVVRVKSETLPSHLSVQKPVENSKTTKKIDKPESAPSPPSQPKKSLFRDILILAILVLIAIGGLVYITITKRTNSQPPSQPQTETTITTHITSTKRTNSQPAKPSSSPQAQQAIKLSKQRDELSKQQIDGLNKQIDELSKQIDGLNKQIDELSKQIDGLNKQIDGLNKQRDGLNKQRDELSKQIDGLNKQIDGSRKQRDGLSKQRDESRKQMESSESDSRVLTDNQVQPTPETRWWQFWKWKIWKFYKTEGISVEQ